MEISNLVFVGIKGSVIAMDRASGVVVWTTHLKGSDFVNVQLDDANLYAVTHGEIFCLDPATGEGRWHNPLKGFGTGLATVATAPSLPANLMALLAERRRREQQAAAASSGAAAH